MVTENFKVQWVPEVGGRGGGRALGLQDFLGWCIWKCFCPTAPGTLLTFFLANRIMT